MKRLRNMGAGDWMMLTLITCGITVLVMLTLLRPWLIPNGHYECPAGSRLVYSQESKSRTNWCASGELISPIWRGD